MKNRKNKLRLILLLCLAVTLLAGCGGEKAPVHPIVGVWKTEDLSFISALPGGETVDSAELSGSVIMTFSADTGDENAVSGSYTCKAPVTYRGDTQTESVDGRYYAKDGTLTLENIMLSYTVSNDTLTLMTPEIAVSFLRQ